MKICIVSQEYPPETADGGIGTQAWNKARGLTELGHEVHVLSCSAEHQPAPIRTEVENGVIVHRLRRPDQFAEAFIPMYHEEVYMLNYTSSILRGLHHITAQTDIDLINFPEYAAEGYAYQLNRSHVNWVPVVVQLHGPLAMFTEKLAWPSKDSNFFDLGTFMEGRSIQMADGLMASSVNIADFAANYYNVSRHGIHVVHCGIDTELFIPPAEFDTKVPPTVLFVGHISKTKGINVVFDAFLRLRNLYPGIRLVIMGKKRDKQLFIDMTIKGKKEGALANVQFIDFVNERHQLVNYYQNAHVFASPAKHEVGVANVYVEAMACGCPVVASTAGGACEAIIDGETGILVPPDNVDATVAAIDRIISYPDTRQKMAKSARKRVEQYFAMDKYIERILCVYYNTIEISKSKKALLKVRF